MNENKLASALTSVAQRMRSDYEQSQLFRHRGEAGTTREVLFREFLANRLPGHVDVLHNAEIVTVTGDVSAQCDIAIVDRSTPALTDLQGYRIVVNECVYGVAEVKTKLDKEKLIDACEKVKRAKKLSKTAYYPAQPQRTRTAYGKTYPYVPTVGMIFAFDSIDLTVLGGHFADWCANNEPEDWPDSIWILGKGFYVWTDPATGLINPTPEPGSSILAMEPWHDENVLLPLTLHLNQHFVTAWMPPLRLIDYAQQHPLGVMLHKWDEHVTPQSE
ncbi:DUF6602 domain-containing protein [Streptomyces sp. H39-S7]|uniref:DUF6602 domain-containing protein n=1 Tax=Streptomyces sp. H39-S7 TaxID=3004357 RepID=UPI0022AE5515|nr:DUF6602 domain-containing protein [Streptomyces sp. H39-S7]MCZ4120212.1 hypothetical protein [Streptomyces sp. H39-S7]